MRYDSARLPPPQCQAPPILSPVAALALPLPPADCHPSCSDRCARRVCIHSSLHLSIRPSRSSSADGATAGAPEHRPHRCIGRLQVAARPAHLDTACLCGLCGRGSARPDASSPWPNYGSRSACCGAGRQRPRVWRPCAHREPATVSFSPPFPRPGCASSRPGATPFSSPPLRDCACRPAQPMAAPLIAPSSHPLRIGSPPWWLRDGAPKTALFAAARVPNAPDACLFAAALLRGVAGTDARPRSCASPCRPAITAVHLDVRLLARRKCLIIPPWNGTGAANSHAASATAAAGSGAAGAHSLLGRGGGCLGAAWWLPPACHHGS